MIFCEKRGREVESCISIKFCDSKKCKFKPKLKKKIKKKKNVEHE